MGRELSLTANLLHERSEFRSGNAVQVRWQPSRACNQRSSDALHFQQDKPLHTASNGHLEVPAAMQEQVEQQHGALASQAPAERVVER